LSERGGLIVSVAPDSLGERLELRPGDRLLAVNGHALRDIIDLQFYGAEECLEVGVERAGQEFSLSTEREYGEDWGLDFAAPLFDGIRSCHNRCPFCFVRGLPEGMRPSLYVHDDDYRLSFLYGNFVTLTNLAEEDWKRLEEQGLSPLYVSVQATEADLRRRLLGGRVIPDVLQQIERLGSIGILVHAQIVLCAGLNTGPALAQTVEDLWQRRDNVVSVAMVPAGLTRYHPTRLEPLTVEGAYEVLAFADGWRRRAYREAGVRFVYPSDELYILAGRPVPGATTYDGFPQLANGVGLVRRWQDEWRRIERRLEEGRLCGQPAVASATLVTGQLFAPFLSEAAQCLERVTGIRCRALAVENRFFGPKVTVAGLLTGRDVAEQLAGQELGQTVVLPRSMFDAAGERTLDDWTEEELSASLERPICTASSPGEMLNRLMA
jgi:putative radical SAM enzyme (TIGR03279 family)